MQLNRSAFFVAAIYFVVSTLYIYLSDGALEFLLAEHEALHFRVSLIKGQVFMLITALMLYAMISRAMSQLAAAKRFSAATIDALSEHIAVIDQRGMIIAVNEAWRGFARTHGADERVVREGVNYFDVCARAVADGDIGAGVIRNGIVDVAHGHSAAFSHEYSCRLPDETLWFNLKATRFHEADSAYIVVAHENITHRKLAEEQVVFLASHDLLTGLLNRKSFIERVETETARARRYRGKFALLAVSVDRFKFIEEAHGLEQSDSLMREVAARLLSAARDVDTICRYDRNEFLVLMGSVDEPNDAARAALRLLGAVSASPCEADGLELSVTASVGISVYPEHGLTGRELILNAGAALTAMRKYGRDHYRFYTEAMNARALEVLTIEQNLRRAIGSDQMRIVFQPQVDIFTGQLIGFETLSRWESPDLGHVSPGSFIPVAEDSGLIIPLGKWVLEETCRHNARWVREGLSRVPASANVSALQFRQDDFVDTVRQTLHRTGLSPDLLELEITESVVVDVDSGLMAKLRALNELGVRLSLDDFGTGYSSLSYLRSLPIHRLKIDQSFVRDLPDNRDSSAIAGAVIGMGQSLGLRVLAEGVENEAQAGFLVSQGCLEGQGYHFGRPMAAVDMAAWMRGQTKH